jgi:hypothetical protein
VLVPLLIQQGWFAGRAGLEPQCRRIESGVASKHSPQTAMREAVSDLIFPADEPSSPSTLFLAQPGTATFQHRGVSIEREAPNMNSPADQSEWQRMICRRQSFNGREGHDRLSYARIH